MFLFNFLSGPECHRNWFTCVSHCVSCIICAGFCSMKPGVKFLFVHNGMHRTRNYPLARCFFPAIRIIEQPLHNIKECEERFVLRILWKWKISTAPNGWKINNTGVLVLFLNCMVLLGIFLAVGSFLNFWQKVWQLFELWKIKSCPC